MNEGPNVNGWSRFATGFFAACFLLTGYLLYLVFRSFFFILVWATVLTVVFHPLFGKILKWTRGRRTAAAFIACLVILILIVLPVTMLGILISQQSVALYHTIQSNIADSSGEAAAKLRAIQDRPWVQWVLSFGRSWFKAESIDLQGLGRQTISAVSRFIVEIAPSLLGGVGRLLYGFLMVFITMFFLFKDGPSIVEFVRSLSPLPMAYESEIIRKFEDVSYATFFGSLLTALVQGTAGALLFWALGIDSPLFWGALISFVSLVPVVGAFLVWVPVSSYLLLSGHNARGFLLLAIGGLVVSSIDNVLKPAIIRGRTDMHPLLVFLSVLGGLEAFGFLGVLLGPLVVAIFLSFLNFYRHRFSGQLEGKA
ncbi:MAG TPA: AI-2E family transporter [Acidobacteriota bacterium]|nr:AI-2E family transporter [Acidobacteriota bacterium]